MDMTTMVYVATVNIPGYLPMNDEPYGFDSALAAWEYLASERERDEDDCAEDGDAYSDAYDTLTTCVQALDSQNDGIVRSCGLDEHGCGFVHGGTPGSDSEYDLGLRYCVSLVKRSDICDCVPHVLGQTAWGSFYCHTEQQGYCTQECPHFVN